MIVPEQRLERHDGKRLIRGVRLHRHRLVRGTASQDGAGTHAMDIADELLGLNRIVWINRLREFGQIPVIYSFEPVQLFLQILRKG